MYRLFMILTTFINKRSEKQLVRIANFLAILVFDILRFRRKLILNNIKIAFGDSLKGRERIIMGRRSIFSFCCTILEFLYSYRHDPTVNVEIEGKEHLDAALLLHQGVFVVCCHIGNWEAYGAKLGSTYGPTWIPAKRIKNEGLNNFINELRARRNFFALKREKKGDGFRGIKEALANNQIVGLVIDQTRPGEPKLPFFNHPATTNTSYAAIWRRVKFPPVIAAYIERTSFFHHKLVILPRVELKVTDQFETDILQHSEIFNQVAEQMIRRRPDLYFWLHARWK